ncbi:hypothetical protein [Haematobacter massiliensis]|uniref:hypothetical protein n=1 Tax=Haematobacter massiliensis TaxID=195105 RepID=UPI0023F14EA0|nr:hypothetical protein [Haematobacter massiliensis]
MRNVTLEAWQGTARAMLAQLDAFGLAANPGEDWPTTRHALLAACFAAQAYEDADGDAAPLALLRSFLIAMINPDSPELDPLRACNRPLQATAEEAEARAFDRADWFWRTMDPDDSGDAPAEALHRGMIANFTICEVASSYTGPTRYGFNAPVLAPESDDEEFLHFATQEEAISAARERLEAIKTSKESQMA